MSDLTDKLDGQIAKGWDRVNAAARTRNRTAVQSALDTVARLEGLRQQQIAIEKNIADAIEADSEPKRPNPETGARGKRQTSRPTEIRIGTFKKRIDRANEIPVVVGNWLIDQGKALPTLRNFVHPTNSDFGDSAMTKRLSSGQYIEVGDDQKSLRRKARRLLDACGHRELKFEILFADGSCIEG